MEGLELGLSHGFRLSAMARYEMTIHRYGVWGRTVAVVIMVVVAALFASPAWRTVQLVLLVAGVSLAWVNAYPELVDTETGSPKARRGALRRWLAPHTANLTTASPDLAGLLEGFGVVAAAFLFAGPLPVTMPAGARVVALVALTAFAWNAFSQVAADPGYYNADPAPARWAVAVRWLLPGAASASALVLLGELGASAPAGARVPWWLAALLAGSLLLIWPYAATLNLLLRCAAESADDEVVKNLGTQERIHYEYVHRAKNELRPDFHAVSSDDAEYLAYSAAVVIVDNALRDIEASASGERDDAHPVAELWRRYRGTISGAAVRERLRLVDRTGARKLSHMEGLILQSILVGLVSNALRASPGGPVVVTVCDEMKGQDAVSVRVAVEDQGAGGAPSTFEQGSGLAHLHDLCGRYSGGVSIADREGGGTRAIAEFSYPRLVSPAGGTGSHSREELSDGQLPGLGGRRRPGVHIGRGRLAAPGK
jgi:hypothetical protein